MKLYGSFKFSWWFTFDQEALELKIEDVYPEGISLSMPKRPPWDYTFSASQLDTNEQEYFKVGKNML